MRVLGSAWGVDGWPWVPACGSLEPSWRGGENAQKKKRKNGGEMSSSRTSSLILTFELDPASMGVEAFLLDSYWLFLSCICAVFVL